MNTLKNTFSFFPSSIIPSTKETICIAIFLLLNPNQLKAYKLKTELFQEIENTDKFKINQEIINKNKPLIKKHKKEWKTLFSKLEINGENIFEGKNELLNEISLICAMIPYTESKFNRNSYNSSSGATGLYQILKSKAKGKNLKNPYINLQEAKKQLSKKFKLRLSQYTYKKYIMNNLDDSNNDNLPIKKIEFKNIADINGNHNFYSPGFKHLNKKLKTFYNISKIQKNQFVYIIDYSKINFSENDLAQIISEAIYSFNGNFPKFSRNFQKDDGTINLVKYSKKGGNSENKEYFTKILNSIEKY